MGNCWLTADARGDLEIMYRSICGTYLAAVVFAIVAAFLVEFSEGQTSLLFEAEDYLETIRKPYALSQFVWSFAPVLSRQTSTKAGSTVETFSPGTVPITAKHLDELMTSSNLGDHVVDVPAWFPGRDKVSFTGLASITTRDP